MIKFQLKGATLTRSYTLPSTAARGQEAGDPTPGGAATGLTDKGDRGGNNPQQVPQEGLALDAVYALAKQHMDLVHPTISRSANHIVLSYVGPGGKENVLRFQEQVQEIVQSGLVTISMKQPGQGPWQVKPGRWKKGHSVGSGSTGNVYVATSLDGANVFAVKEVIVNPETSGATLRRMKEEMSMIMKLPPHQNIVQYYGMERTTTALYVFLEYVAGGSIRMLLNRLAKPLHESVIREYTRQILTGLTFLHEHHIVHGDIKGGNCLVDVDGTVKLADFGSSGKANDAEWSGLRGTSLWMSPECVKGAMLTTATDIWSMACTVLEMATGRPPWFELNFTNNWAAMYHLSQAERGPNIPPHLTPAAHDFLSLCLRVNAAERPTASELLQHAFVTTEVNPEDVSEYVVPPLSAPPAWQESSLASSNCSMSFNVIDPEQETVRTHLDVGSFHLPSITGQGINPEARNDAVRTALRRAKVEAASPPHQVAQVWNPLRDLTEPVLFNILKFLSPRSLCQVSQLSKETAQIINGMNEALWKRHFINVFGEVDNVRSALRKGWKMYYSDSVKYRGVRLAEGTLSFRRRLTHARTVFEGLNEIRQRIILVVEVQKQKPPMAGTMTRPSRLNETYTRPDPRTKTPQRRAQSNGPAGASLGSPHKPSPTTLLGSTMASTMLGTMSTVSPIKSSTSLPTLQARMMSPAEVTKVQKMRKQQMDNMMNGTNTSIVSGYRPFQGPGGLDALYDGENLMVGNQGGVPNLQTYNRVVTHLEGCPGVVRPLAYLESPSQNVLALPYLGTSLNELLLVCANQFTHRTVCLVALQAIDILAEIHRREILHYCITPSHIVVDDAGHVHLINFKYARTYTPSSSHGASSLPAPSRRPSSHGALARHKESLFFMSAYAQKGLTPGPRDDAIALGYVLCYLLKGGLPWIADQPPSDQALYLAKKAYASQIARTPPLQLYHYLKHCNDLKQGELPDYAFLKNVFARWMAENKWTADGQFEWTSQVMTPSRRCST